MTKVTIPATIEEATAGLDGIGRLLVAKEWEKSAIVYAYAKPGKAGAQSAAIVPTDERLSFTAFAKLGVTGLRSHEDVAAYWRAWDSAIQDGAVATQPGMEVELPTLPWKSPYGDTSRGQEAVEDRAFKRILKSPERFAAAVEDPDVADLVADRVADTPAIRWRAEETIRETKPEETTRQTEPREPNKAIEAVITAINTFWDHPITHNDQQMTYRQVIEVVRDNPDAMLQASLAPTASLHLAMAKALERMAIEARRLGEPLMIKAGGDE
jgi:hypothetical protein